MSALPNDINTLNRSARPMRRLAAALAKVANTIIYECPSGKSATIESITICNTHNATVTVRVFHTSPNETAGAVNALFYDLSLPTASTTVDDSKRYLNSGDRLTIYASTASGVAVAVHGLEA